MKPPMPRWDGRRHTLRQFISDNRIAIQKRLNYERLKKGSNDVLPYT